MPWRVALAALVFCLVSVGFDHWRRAKPKVDSADVVNKERRELIRQWRAMIYDVNQQIAWSSDQTDTAIRQRIARHKAFSWLRPHLTSSTRDILEGRAAYMYHRVLEPGVHPIIELVANEIDRIEGEWGLFMQ